MPKQRQFPFLGLALAVCALIGLQACADSESPGLTEPSVIAAKTSPTGAPVKVTEAIPSEAPQEVTLDVEVLGRGFDRGSVVRFLLDEEDEESAPGMIVNRSVFVSSKKLIANLTITTDAVIDLHDIEVTTKRGKKGIGSEMFLVKDKNAHVPSELPVIATFDDAPGDRVTSDGGGAYDAVILQIGNLMLDARGDILRKLCFDFAGQENAPVAEPFCDYAYLTTAVPDREGGLPAMEPGTTTTMTTRLQVTWVMKDASGKGYNWFLRFGRFEGNCDSNDIPADRSVVSHPDADTWILEGDTASLCRLPIKGRPVGQYVGTFSMPFTLTVEK
jgi:hypothetical protein